MSPLTGSRDKLSLGYQLATALASRLSTLVIENGEPSAITAAFHTAANFASRPDLRRELRPEQVLV
jgi:hypothetical protein